MRYQTAAWLLFSCFAATSAQDARADIIRTMAFDAGSDWTGLRSVSGAIGNNFGFQTSNNTQGTSPAGEAGGTFARTTQVSYYADTNLGGTIDFNRPFQASGEVVLMSTSNFNNGVSIGHRDTSPSSVGSQFMNFVGFQIAEPQGLRVTSS